MRGDGLPPDLAIPQLQRDLDEVRADLDQVRSWVAGNGDPKQGLLWLAADLGRMLSSLSELVTAQSTLTKQQGDALVAHISDAHTRRGESVWNWTRLAYDIVRQVTVLTTTALLVLLVLGLRTWIGTL